MMIIFQREISSSMSQLEMFAFMQIILVEEINLASAKLKKLAIWCIAVFCDSRQPVNSSSVWVNKIKMQILTFQNDVRQLRRIQIRIHFLNAVHDSIFIFSVLFDFRLNPIKFSQFSFFLLFFFHSLIDAYHQPKFDDDFSHKIRFTIFFLEFNFFTTSNSQK